MKTNNKVFLKNDDEFKKIIEESTKWSEIGEKLNYNPPISSNVKRAIEYRCSLLGINVNIVNKKQEVSSQTKKNIFEKRKNWQSARSAIQKNARLIFFKENMNPKCFICGYDKHVEVAHIKPVSEFDENATILEINDINNLIGLCPNHHWEYDNNLLNIEKKYVK